MLQYNNVNQWKYDPSSMKLSVDSYPKETCPYPDLSQKSLEWYFLRNARYYRRMIPRLVHAFGQTFKVR